ncbi:MAG: hypothetical protein OXI43_10115 [Candidatus Poribacteria bacterium]|nr:hypothetical protein [Candidatus Poribacteria bacterium]
MSIQDVINQTIADDELGYNGIPEEVYAVVTFDDGRKENWDVSIINHLQAIDMITDPKGIRYHQLSELKALGITGVQIRFIHKVFGFNEEESDAV